MAKAQGKANDPIVEISLPEGFGAFITPIAIILSAIIISAAVIYGASRVTGKVATNDTATQDTTNDGSNTGSDTTTTPGKVVRTFNTFTEYDTTICKKDGKPIIYLFSTTWCPHCQLAKPIFDKFAKDNASKAYFYHWELDTKDNTLTSAVETSVPADAQAIYEKFNPEGTIPTFVFGCRYGRVGNGFESNGALDKTKEVDAYTKVLNALLGK